MNILENVVFCCCLALYTVKVIGLRCPPCEKLHCSPQKLFPGSCKGGVKTGICGCCPTCAKVLGERCGGEFGYLGKCDQGLYCEPLAKSPKTSEFVPISESAGICTKLAHTLSDEGRTPYCYTLCSPTFCIKNPRSICSAINVAEVYKECQGHCQHTSCSACHYVTQIVCPQCRKDDYQCIKKYGRCVKRHFRSLKKFPRRRKLLKKVEGSKFVCKVPACVGR